MDEQDEATRRELLLKARAVLESEYKVAEMKLHTLNEQIALKQKDVNALKDQAVIEEMNASSRLAKVRQDAADEEATIKAKLQALTVQLQMMESSRVKLSAETDRECAVLADRIRTLQDTHADLSANVLALSGRLSEMKASLLTIRRTLEGLTL